MKVKITTLLWLSKSETCQACSYMMSGLLRGFTKFVFCPHVIRAHGLFCFYHKKTFHYNKLALLKTMYKLLHSVQKMHEQDNRKVMECKRNT